MHITRSLGIRYLWIDSLCIVQSGDNGADWLREASQMARYYQHAITTISAPAIMPFTSIAADRTGATFRNLFRMPYRNARGSVDGFFHVYRPSFNSLQVYQDQVRDSELLTRVWIFQEWFLSCRIIYYTPHELFLECRTEGCKSERQHPMRLTNARDIDLRNGFRQPGFGHWYRLVELYSTTRLTCPEKDHIIALSGVAHEFREGRRVNLDRRRDLDLSSLPTVAFRR